MPARTRTAATSSYFVIIITLPSLTPSCDRSVTPPSTHAISAATSLQYGCSPRLLCGAVTTYVVTFSFRVDVPVYAVLSSVLCVLARTDYYYYY